MPCNYAEYPPNWFTEIRPRILARAKNCCEWCGVENGAHVSPDVDGKLWTYEAACEATKEIIWASDKPAYKVVLTISHFDHNKANNSDSNLNALCQRCHLNHDREHHMQNRSESADEKRGQLQLIPTAEWRDQ